ncbi:hypothetical protein BS47DRAFT_357836 [Hydnum rufescens UP504]|uniref:Uncharacterized protein n=1 Tax=Hydnum rufescens UP504 TaxID=1448309 RepID=A0A9P6DQ64_9AGAM|nr:hypothetical protein BS47DRAFT_357836 [Hydnum rufescens UP504]
MVCFDHFDSDDQINDNGRRIVRSHVYRANNTGPQKQSNDGSMTSEDTRSPSRGRFFGSSTLSSLSDTDDPRSRPSGPESRALTSDIFSPSRVSATLSDAPPPSYTGSPTRSRSPWPPVSEADSEELEVEQNLEPSEADSSMAAEEIIAELHSNTLDPVNFERHALSHISEANEDGTRASILSRDYSISGQREYLERRGSPTSLRTSSDFGSNAVRRTSIFSDINRVPSSTDVPPESSRRSAHIRASTDPSETLASPSVPPVRHTASPVGRRAAGLIALFEEKSETGSIGSGAGSISSLAHGRAASASSPFAPSQSMPSVSAIPRDDATSPFPRSVTFQSLSSSRPTSPTKPRPVSPVKSRPGSPSKPPPGRPFPAAVPPPPPPKESSPARPPRAAAPPTPSAPLPSAPQGSFARPSTARRNIARSPLTSVRNIVAAWTSKERHDPSVNNKSPSLSGSPVTGSDVPQRPLSFGEGSFSIRRRGANAMVAHFQQLQILEIATSHLVYIRVTLITNSGRTGRTPVVSERTRSSSIPLDSRPGSPLSERPYSVVDRSWRWPWPCDPRPCKLH